MTKLILVETTYPNLRSAKNLAKILLSKNLAACVQLCEVKSMYFWQGELQNDREILLRIKTKNSLYPAVEKIIQEHHSYKIPQILAIQIDRGSKAYLNWLDSQTETTGK
jgi:periplasmic divalent cation tolerance protein